MQIHYLEIVTNEVDATCATYASCTAYPSTNRSLNWGTPARRRYRLVACSASVHR